MKFTLAKTVIAAGLLLAGAQASAANFTYEVTITNLTKGQIFTPVFMASVKRDVTLFEYGQAASPELVRIAEGGDSSALKASLEAGNLSHDSTAGSAPVLPGTQQQFTLNADRHFRNIILSTMMLPTNDGFVAINGLKMPRRGSRTYWLTGNDAGSETNDELRVTTPGPFGGEAFSANDTGEGFVHVHNGIHGIGDFPPATYDWGNPVAKVVIKRVRH